MQRVVVLLLLASSGALVAALWATGLGLGSLWGLGVVPATHAAVLAVEFAVMRHANASDPAPRAPLALSVRAWLRETLHFLLVFGIWQPFRSQSMADHLPGQAPQALRGPTPGEGKPPGQGLPRAARGVLLVHGFVCNRGLWRGWMKQLRNDDVPCMAVNLEPVFGRIEDYAGIIEQAVQRLEGLTGQPPIVVAHSMGGLAVRHWWAQTDCTDRLHHLITLGSPHHGTRLARLGVAPNARQMRPANAWLGQLARRELPDMHARTTCFYSHCDNIVFPASSATLPGAANRHLTGVGHVSLVFRPEPLQELRRQLAD